MDTANKPSTPELLRAIAGDTGELIRKEVELARQEIVEAVLSRVKGVASFAVAGVFALFGLTFAASSVAHALEPRAGAWGSRLIVAGGFLVVAMIAGLVGLGRFRSPAMAPEETKRTVKEDIQWAKAQLKR